MPSTWRLLTWNVNSVRARLDHVLTYLAEHQPDIACLQETKVEDRLFPKVPFLELGYSVTTHGAKGHAGVATLSRQQPHSTRSGFEGPYKDRHARILVTQIDDVEVYNLYVPNGQAVDSEAYDYKLEWLAELRAELNRGDKAARPLILCGDFNIAFDDRDLYDPEPFVGRVHCTDRERQAFSGLLELGLEDCFRRLQPEGGHFSWYDYRANGFARGLGMRIDYVLASSSLASRCRSADYDSGPRGWDSPSDHLPMMVEFAAP